MSASPLLKNLLIKNANLAEIDMNINETNREILILNAKLKDKQVLNYEDIKNSLKLINSITKMEGLKNSRNALKKTKFYEEYSCKRKSRFKKKLRSRKKSTKKKSKKKSCVKV